MGKARCDWGHVSIWISYFLCSLLTKIYDYVATISRSSKPLTWKTLTVFSSSAIYWSLRTLERCPECLQKSQNKSFLCLLSHELKKRQSDQFVVIIFISWLCTKTQDKHLHCDRGYFSNEQSSSLDITIPKMRVGVAITENWCSYESIYSK